MWERLANQLGHHGGRWWIKSHQGAYIAVSETLSQRLGTSKTRMLGRGDWEFWTKEDAAQFRIEDHFSMARGVAVSIPEAHPREGYLITAKIPLYRSGAGYATLGVTYRESSLHAWERRGRHRIRQTLRLLAPRPRPVTHPGNRTPLALYTQPLRSRQHPRWLRAARKSLEANFRSPPSLDGLAATVGVHPNHLGRVFRSKYGVTVQRFIRARRCEWAAVALLTRPVTLSSIALAAGFADQSHFTRSFRAEIGCTPGEFRGRATGGAA